MHYRRGLTIFLASCRFFRRTPTCTHLDGMGRGDREGTGSERGRSHRAVRRDPRDARPETLVMLELLAKGAPSWPVYPRKMRSAIGPRGMLTVWTRCFKASQTPAIIIKDSIENDIVDANIAVNDRCPESESYYAQRPADCDHARRKKVGPRLRSFCWRYRPEGDPHLQR
jgi:hypothetical protein